MQWHSIWIQLFCFNLFQFVQVVGLIFTYGNGVFFLPSVNKTTYFNKRDKKCRALILFYNKIFYVFYYAKYKKHMYFIIKSYLIFVYDFINEFISLWK